MFSDDTKRKLQNIIGGTQITWEANNCTTARNLLCRSFGTNTKVKKDRQAAIKEEQSEILTDFINDHNLWIAKPPETSHFLTQGGEAEIYFLPGEGDVIKLNDAIY